MVQFCKVNSICILNGRKKGDTIGRITCIANGGKSKVDYALCHVDIYPIIDECHVIPRSESDHFPISISLVSYNLSQHETPTHAQSEMNLHCFQKVSWSQNDQAIYVNKLSELLSNITATFNEYIDTRDVDSAVDLLNKCIRDAAVTRSKSNNKWNTQNIWFDEDCKTLKQEKYTLLNLFHRTNSTQVLREYLMCRNRFKNVCKYKKRAFYNTKSINFLKNSIKSSKQFWRDLKILTTSPQTANPNIHPSEWYAYFKDLLNPVSQEETDTTPTEQ